MSKKVRRIVSRNFSAQFERGGRQLRGAASHGDH
jgi:hypothetical protein